MIEVLSKCGWLHSALLPPTCIGDVDPRGIEGAVGPGQLCHGHIQRFPGKVEVAEDGTDNADTSKWEQYLQGKRGPSARDPLPLPALASTPSLSCHISPYPCRKHPKLFCSNTLCPQHFPSGIHVLGAAPGLFILACAPGLT